MGKYSDIVAPFTGAWIEIRNLYKLDGKIYVAPFTGAWIEILVTGASTMNLSLPSRGRGLKYDRLVIIINKVMSLPSRGRGLKFHKISQYP